MARAPGAGAAPLAAALVLLLAAASLLAPGLAPPPSGRGGSVVDERGVRVAIPPGPQRVALYMGIGAGEYLVDGAQPRGLSVQANSDNAFVLHSAYLNRALPDLRQVRTSLKDTEGPTANVEALLAARPPVLLVTWARLADRFERVGLPVVGMLGLSTPERHLDNARIFTAVAGRPERDAGLRARYAAARASVARAIAQLGPEPRPRLATVEFPSAGPLRAFPLAPDEAEAAGGRDALPIHGGAAFIDAERLLAADPDVLVVPWPGATLSTTPARLAASPVFRSLRAVRCGQAYAAPPGVTGYAWSLVEEPVRYRWLAETLHPRLPDALAGYTASTYAAAFGVRPTSGELATLLSTGLNPPGHPSPPACAR